MEYDYETVMTVGQTVTVNLNNDYFDEDYYQELPRPEGEGWQLKYVLPVHNNHRFLQYFWERKVFMGELGEAGEILSLKMLISTYPASTRKLTV